MIKETSVHSTFRSILSSRLAVVHDTGILMVMMMVMTTVMAIVTVMLMMAIMMAMMNILTVVLNSDSTNT